MHRFIVTLGFALLFSASIAAQQTSSSSNSDQNGQSASSAPATQNQSATQPSSSATQQDQSNPKGGSPNTPIPGRVTGETPTEVQQALDKELPAGSDVTASVADDGSLKLTGTVKNDADKSKAEQIARQKTNKEISNQIQVKSGSSEGSSTK
jgi:osmotically-inducible protein OsmY